MKKLLALLLALAVILPCAALFAPAAKADSLYIIPGSDTRRLTWDELEKSVVSHAADDIRVFIRGNTVQMTIILKIA